MELSFDLQHGGTGLKLLRSPRHSRFAECTRCQTLRKAYHIVAANRSASPEAVQEAYDALKAHMDTWTDDREIAMALRHASYDPLSEYCYECDDKCGSQWQSLPVNETGRYTKEEEDSCYSMSVQANVVCGPRGLIRLAMVPKNVGTGANFGISLLILTLHRTYELGLLEGKKFLLRHTDGGSDNVSRMTHVMHWLLVFIGCFDLITWFRFDAGHSHTEIADRLFGMMKRLFDTDHNTRVQGCPDFVALEAKLRVLFKDQREDFDFIFHFANWNISVKSLGAAHQHQ